MTTSVPAKDEFSLQQPLTLLEAFSEFEILVGIELVDVVRKGER